MAKYFGGGGGGGGGAVSSVFGRIGGVVAALGDYAASLVTNDSAVAGATVANALNALGGAIAGLVTGVSSVFGRAGAVVAAVGDYTGVQVTASGNIPGTRVSDQLNYFGQAAAAVAGGATPALPFATNRYQILTLSANASPTVTIPPAGIEVILEVIQPASGGPWVITAWPATVDWSVAGVGGGPPSLSTVANAINMYKFVSNGSRLRGFAVGEY